MLSKESKVKKRLLSNLNFVYSRELIVIIYKWED